MFYTAQINQRKNIYTESWFSQNDNQSYYCHHYQRNLQSAFLQLSFRVTKVHVMISRFFAVLCTVINLYFAWLLRICVCDNAHYTSKDMLVLPYNWNIEYQRKKFISKVALTELIMKPLRHLPTPLSLHVIRHLRLWHSLSALFHIFYPTVCLSSSIIPLFVVSGKPTLYLVLWNVTNPELCERGNLVARVLSLFRESTLVLDFSRFQRFDWGEGLESYSLSPLSSPTEPNREWNL